MTTSETRAPADLGSTCGEGVGPMGRGRAKAKQTKVARDLKYRSIETDFSQLQRELHGDDGAHDGAKDGAQDRDRGTDDESGQDRDDNRSDHERADEESTAR